MHKLTTSYRSALRLKTEVVVLITTTHTPQLMEAVSEYICPHRALKAAKQVTDSGGDSFQNAHIHMHSHTLLQKTVGLASHNNERLV